MRISLRSASVMLAMTGAMAIPASAQVTAYRTSVRVTGNGGEPVVGAEVKVFVADTVFRLLHTGDDGHVAFETVPPRGGMVMQVRRLGFHPWSTVPGASIAGPHDVVLEPMPVGLDGVVTVGQAGGVRLREFEAHRKRSQFGQFFDSESIEAKNPRQLSELLRFVPGVRLIPTTAGNVVRIRGCRPLLWIDGVRLPGAEVDEWVNMRDVAAVEVYNSYAGIPPQYVDRATNCGAVVVWMK